MKVLWLVNVVMPEPADVLGMNGTSFGGWLTGALNGIYDKLDSIIIVTIGHVREIKKIQVENKTYIIYPYGSIGYYETQFKALLDEEDCDVIHIFGTEYAQSTAMFNVANPNRTVIYIQGLMSKCSYHFLDGIPYTVFQDTWRKKLLRFFHIGNKPLIYSKEGFLKRAPFELDILKNAKYFLGRTSWDYACIAEVNSSFRYFHVNETLRDSFYTSEKWNYDKCEKHTVFLSQGFYSIKGLHNFLHAAKILKERYPDFKVYIAGPPLKLTVKNKFDKWVNKNCGDYTGYILSLIEQFGLENSCFFIGMLDEADMIKAYLKANVFVVPSNIENSPNSLGEAMILGVPCVCSYVGGVPDMMDNEKEGILYQPTAPYMLAYAVSRIFDDNQLAMKFSEYAIERAVREHNSDDNAEKLLQAYSEIAKTANSARTL